MDFFQHQDQARRSSRWLIAYFCLAVMSIVAAVYFAGSWFFFWLVGENRTTVDGRGGGPNLDWWDTERFIVFAGGTLLVISLGSLYKIWQLSRGGAKVAELLGGRPIDPNTRDPQERQVLNVVEEMAIAAGLPVPTLYLLEDRSINAFAAGFTPNDAVIGVTRGTVNLLSRDELQGVIAHEFSHIFNGDMRLNIRLMGVLHGILVIGLIGYFILRSSGRSRRNKGGGGMMLFGLALVILGYAGVFFARLIQAAVSRQREFLADASAVQYTRNPAGIAGALKKIGGLVQGSTILSPQAVEARHLFFGDAKHQAVHSSFNLTATHPPLTERITRIEPKFNGVYPEVQADRVVAPAGTAPAKPTSEPRAREREARERFVRVLIPAQMAASVGTISEGHVQYARRLIDGLPERLRAMVHDPSSARAVVLALLTDRRAEIRAKQFELLARANDPSVAKETREAVSLLEKASPEVRLPLVDLAIPALKRLSPGQYEELDRLVDAMIRADASVDLFEYTLMHILRRHLKPAFSGGRAAASTSVKYYGWAALRKECSVLLSAMAYAGHSDDGEAKGAFQAAARQITGANLILLSRTGANLKAVSDALDKLLRVAPKLKKCLMEALATSAAHDGKITVTEGELLRAVAEGLDLPLPPLLPGQELAKTGASRAGETVTAR